MPPDLVGQEPSGRSISDAEQGPQTQTPRGDWQLFADNAPPRVTLVSPTSGGPTSETMLAWRGSDTDGDELTYDVFFGTSVVPTNLVAIGINESFYIPTHHLFTAGTFYWRVEVSDGVDRTGSESWNFTFEPLVPYLNITGGELGNGAYMVHGTASDEHQVVAIQVRIDDGAWQTLPGNDEWVYPWQVEQIDFSGAQTSAHVITARAFDGFFYSEEDGLDVILTKPTLSIDFHGFDFYDRSRYTILGTATGMEGGLSVQVRVDEQGGWQTAVGQQSWEFEWSTIAEEPGNHTLYLRAFDGVWSSPVRTIDVDVAGVGAAVGTVPAKLKGERVLQVSLANPNPASRVQVRISSGDWSSDWQEMEGTTSGIGTYAWDTEKVADGPYTIEFRYLDGFRVDHLGSFAVKVINHDHEETSWSALCLIFIPFAFLMLLALWLLYGERLEARERLLGFYTRYIMGKEAEEGLEEEPLVEEEKEEELDDDEEAEDHDKPAEARLEDELEGDLDEEEPDETREPEEVPEKEASHEAELKASTEPGKETETPEQEQLTRKDTFKPEPEAGKARRPPVPPTETSSQPTEAEGTAMTPPLAKTKPTPKPKPKPREPCIYCGATRNLHSYHVVRGGQDPVTACASCDMSRRSNKDLEEWLAWTKERKPAKWDKIVAHNMGRRGEVAEIVREMRD